MEHGLKQDRPDSVTSLLPRLRDCAGQLANDQTWHEKRVDPFSLFLQLALHLPRFDLKLANREEVMLAEGSRLADRLAAIRQETQDRVPESGQTRLADMTLVPISDEVARPILESYHYLMSYRFGSIHFGLRSGGDGWPVVLATLSPFDLDNVAPALGEGAGSALVLSRMYAFPGAPRNAISFALSRVREWLTVHRPDVKALLTYCNPNLGFTGASYEADNWRLLGYEHSTRYAYVNGDYVTDRRLAELYGTLPETLVRDDAGRGISFSSWPLAPLQLYVRSIQRKREDSGSEPGHFQRWVPTCSSPPSNALELGIVLSDD